MKSIFASSIVISLILFAGLSYARKEPEDYWKSMMKDKPMPKALEDLYHRDDRRIFVKDFDRKSSNIIYHRRSEPTTEKQQQQQEKKKSFKKELKVPAYTGELEKKLNQIHN